jgi:hypothetical protein
MERTASRRRSNPRRRLPRSVFAVGTAITDRPPHRSGRAQLRHPAPTRSVWRQAVYRCGCRTRPSACDTFSRFCARPVLCWFAFLPVPALRSTGSSPVARLCSLASSLLWQSQTSRVRASSASTPRLPDADQWSSSTGQTRDLPIPAQRASTHARVSDHAGLGGHSR